ncbi:MAG: protein kinase [Myxococcota bacterium]
MTRSVDPAAFEIRQCLGAGGFGEVYLATQAGTGDVALKVLHNGLDPRSQAVQRLRDEARLLGLLDHPSILSIRDLVLLDGRVALVTEYIDGLDLENLLVSRPAISLPAGLEVLSHVASALQSAFTTIGPKGRPLGLLHRDIKPGNIRVGRDGSVKLLDFGIAKATGVTREAKTRTSGVLGSFAYMAPERFDPKQVDTPAGDVCSLGFVLYELLSGGHMLLGDYDIKDLFGLALMPDRRQEVLEERLGALSAPPGVLDLLHEMLAHDPLQRPALADLSDRLDTLAGEVAGPRLKAWAASYAWPDAPHLPGGLTGRTLTGASLGTGNEPAPHTVESVVQSTLTPDQMGDDDLRDVRVAFTDERPKPGSAERQSVLTSAPIDVDDDDLPPLPEPGGPRWGLIALVGLLVLALGLGGGIAGAAGLGLFLSGGPASPPEVEPTPGPVVQRPVPPGPSVAPDPMQPVPAGPVPSVVAPVPSGPVPGGPVPDAIDPVPDAIDPVPEAQPVVAAPTPQPGDLASPGPDAVVGFGTGRDGCGTLTDIELDAALGTVAPEKRTCLEGLMRDTALKQTDRDKVGRVVLKDARAVCDNRGDCARYEALQREFFEEISQSDPDMVTGFVAYLYSTANNRPDRLAEVDQWAIRALERRDQWKGATRRSRLLQLHELRGRAAYQRFTLDSSPTNADYAVERTAEWAETLRQFNSDATPAMELCASAAGNRARCEKRVTTEAVTVTIRFASIPLGATVTIDGTDYGTTPKEVSLPHGRHTVRMALGEAEGEHAIQVGGGEAVQWLWRRDAGAWEAAF